MKQSKIIGKSIFPDFEQLTPDLISFNLKEYGVSMEFLFDDGVEFSWDDSILKAKNYPGDISFYSVGGDGKEILVLTYIENWDYLMFENASGETILTIPIYEEHEISF